MKNSVFDKLQAFSFKQMLDAVSLYKRLNKIGTTVNDFIRVVEEEVEDRKKQIREDAVKVKTASGKSAKSSKMEKPPAPPAKEKKYPETMSCPECGQAAYAQSVCPGCAKGKAGIKRQYICGECNFAFYLD